jgi:hypothetical protein
LSTKELKSPQQWQNAQPKEIGQSEFYGQNSDKEPSEINRTRKVHRNVNMVNYGEHTDGRPGSRWFGQIPVGFIYRAANFYRQQSRTHDFVISGPSQAGSLPGNLIYKTPDNDTTPGVEERIPTVEENQYCPVIEDMSEYEDRAYLIGDDTVFRCIMETDIGGLGPYAYRINVDPPTEIIPDDPEDPTHEYGYRYIYTGIFMEGLNAAQVTISLFTAVAATDLITVPSSTPYPTGTLVQVSSAVGATLPAGLAINTDYFSIRVDATTIRLATSIERAMTGDYIDLTDAGTGNHYITTMLRQNRVSDGVRIGLETGTCKNPNYEKDWGEVFFADEIQNDPACHEFILPDGSLCVPFDGTNGRWREYTHFGIYRTKNIGYNSGGRNPLTGLGNDPEFYCWVEDVPCCKAFSITISTNTMFCSQGQFTQADNGSILRDSAGNTGTITSVTSPFRATLAGGHSLGAGATTLCLGSSTVMTASQTGTAITRTAGAQFLATDVGMPFFWADGGMSIISTVSTPNLAQATNSTAHVAQAATFHPTRRGFSDILPDDETQPDTAGLRERMMAGAFGTDIYIPPRFYTPLPEGNRIVVDSGYMFIFNTDSSTVYYCDIAAKEYWAGQYRADLQFFVLPANIVDARVFPGLLSFFCVGKTLNLALNVSSDQGENKVGEKIPKLAEPSIVDENIGIASPEHARALVAVRAGVLIGLTDEPAVRFYDGTGWSRENIALDADQRGAVQKYIESLVGTGIFGAYTEQGGYILWLDYYQRSGSSKASTKLALRYAVSAAQGEGWSEYRGDEWLWPSRLGADGNEMRGQILSFIDRVGNKRTIFALDYVDMGTTYAIWFEHSTWERAAEYGPSYADKSGVPAAYGITEEEIETETWFGEETVSPIDEHSKLEDMVSHFGFRPQSYHDRGITGYTDAGYRNAQAVSLEVHADGDIAAPLAVVSDIPENGDVVFPGTHVEARRLLYVLKTAASSFKMTCRSHTLLPKREQGSRTERIMGETTDGRLIVDNLAYRMSRHRLPLYEYVRAAQIATTANCTLITGPDGRARSAFQLDANINLQNAAIAGAYTLIFWRQAGVTIPALPALTQYGAASGAWTMQYVQNNNCPADVIITAGSIYDVLICDADVTAALAAIYRDVLNNAGKAFGVFF